TNTTGVFNSLASGSYTITVRDITSCTATTSVSVSDYNRPALSFTLDTSICNTAAALTLSSTSSVGGTGAFYIQKVGGTYPPRSAAVTQFDPSGKLGKYRVWFVWTNNLSNGGCLDSISHDIYVEYCGKGFCTLKQDFWGNTNRKICFYDAS